MSFRDWFRPRRLLAPFLALALAPAAALIWVGARLIQQERSLQDQRTQERLENAIDLIAAALQREIAALEERLSLLAMSPDPLARGGDSGPAHQLWDDAVLVTFSPERIDSHPPGRLAYYPVAPAATEHADRALVDAERLEFRSNDVPAAIAAYRKLAESPEPRIRAAALLALGRTLRKTGQAGAALAAYDDLAGLRSTPIRGYPAELLARQARCALLEAAGRISESQREAEVVYANLEAGRWQLPRDAYRFHLREARRRMPPVADARELESREEARLALAAGEGETAGRQVRLLSGRWLALIWRSGTARMAALVAGPGFLERQWLQSVQPLAERNGVRLALADPQGEPLLGALPGGARQVSRAASETRLPWTLRVAAADAQADRDQALIRRRLWWAGFALLCVTVLAGFYFVTRSLARELQLGHLKSDFVAAVSHEFRTPLTSMCQLAEIFEQDRVADQEQRSQYYGVLARETRRLRRLVEALLDFARMEGGAREYRLAPLDAVPLIREVVAEFQQEAALRGYRVELNIEAPALRICADEEALRRALWNLLDNAVKYSPQQFTVRVEVGRAGRRLSVRVRDHGIGIPQAERQEIFKKFVRGSSSRQAGAKGSGIGLAMVAHIVRAHHGTVAVESEPGRGSTFAVELPLED